MIANPGDRNSNSLAPHEALRRYWGYDSFRPWQEEAVEAALGGRDALVVLATGGGKSLCYQMPAACGRGLVVVISPLIALMDDQVAAAREAGLRAGALHCNLHPEDRSQLYDSLWAGSLDLLYFSPERMVVGDLLPRLEDRLVLVAVDEAHCVSHWGHEFRPEYRQLTPVLEQVPAAARMALTATATQHVQDDICARLGLRSPARLIGHPDRPNLIYRAIPRHDQSKQILEVIQRHPGEGGIVYVRTRKDVERLAHSLSDAGVSCAPYHAGLPPGQRARTQSDFVNERLAVIVATVAFGMGIDRSNVRFVVHANTPRSVEHYQQESGRAGRDGLPADCVLLHSSSDLVSLRALIARDGDLPPERATATERQLKEIGLYAVAPVCRHRLLSEHFGVDYPPGNTPPPLGETNGCGACDVCLGETDALDPDQALATAQKIISAVGRTGSRFGAGYVIKVLLGKSDDRVASNGHDGLGVFGILESAGEKAVRYWIDQLVTQEFLAIVEESGYPLLKMTDSGRDLCRGVGSVCLGTPSKAKRKRKSRVTREGVAPVAADRELFERLRILRKSIAQRRQVPPYVIFHDAALEAMADRKPRSPDELLDIKGIGARKMEQYGDAFLRVIAGDDPELVVAMPK